MKKFLLVSCLLCSIILSWCYSKTSQEISIDKPIEMNISKQGNYSLDCKTKNYTSILIGWELIKESTIRIQEWHERDTLYVEWNTAKFFGADYVVIQDDSSTLIIMRNYEPSWLSEIVTINKTTGIGFDTKTLSSGISGWPNTDTYLISCVEV